MITEVFTSFANDVEGKPHSELHVLPSSAQYFVQAQNMRHKRKKIDHAKTQRRKLFFFLRVFAPLREILVVASPLYTIRTIYEGTTSQKRPYLPLLLILLLAFGLRLVGLNSQNLWWDELKTWERATLPLNEMFAGLIGIRDQVPFYYWLMRFWAKIGADSFILRLFSVYWGMASVAVIYKIGSRLGNKFTGLLAAFLLAISPFHIWYSQEVRMYALLPALLLLAHDTLLRLLNENRWQLWSAYGLFMTAALYTHYFAFFMVLIHYIFFVLHMRQIRQQTVSWFVTMLAVGAAFAPWAYLVITQTDGYRAAVPGWINLIQWSDLPLTLTVFAVGFGLGGSSWLTVVGTAVFLVGLGSSLYFLPPKKDGEDEKRPLSSRTLHARLLFIWFVLPLTIAFLVSIENDFLPTGGFSIYHDRYLIIILPPFLLLTALGWQRFAHRWAAPEWAVWQQAALGLILLLIILISGLALEQQVNNPAFARSGWQAAFTQIDANSAQPAVIIGQKDVLLPVRYYGNGRFPFVQIPPPEADEITPIFAEAMTQQLAIAAEKTGFVWHVEPYYNFDPHGYPDVRNSQVASTANTPTKIWLDAQFTQLEQLQLPGIRLTLYNIAEQSE